MTTTSRIIDGLDENAEAHRDSALQQLDAAEGLAPTRYPTQQTRLILAAGVEAQLQLALEVRALRYALQEAIRSAGQ